MTLQCPSSNKNPKHYTKISWNSMASYLWTFTRSLTDNTRCAIGVCTVLQTHVTMSPCYMFVLSGEPRLFKFSPTSHRRILRVSSLAYIFLLRNSRKVFYVVDEIWRLMLTSLQEQSHHAVIQLRQCNFLFRSLSLPPISTEERLSSGPTSSLNSLNVHPLYQ